MNRTSLLAGLLVGAALLPACSGDDDAATTTVEATTTTSAPERSTTTSSTRPTTTTVAPTTTTTIPDIPRMPLTGEPIDDPSEIPDRPALVVKISNAPRSVMPQAGLNQADLVIEEVINDRETRLAAVFHTQDADPVGPIRSGRAQDINLLLALDRPLFAWSGGNPAVTRAIRESDLIDLSSQHSSGYYRRSGRRSPNNLYSDTEALWAQTTDEAITIEVTLDNVRARWEYDEEDGRYYRWQNGVEHTTETSDGVEPVWVDNVVVMKADYGVNTFDGNPDAQVLGSNPVYVFTGGTVQEGTWLRFKAEDPYGYFDNVVDLNRLGLQPGRTWLEIPRNFDDVLTWS